MKNVIEELTKIYKESELRSYERVWYSRLQFFEEKGSRVKSTKPAKVEERKKKK